MLLAMLVVAAPCVLRAAPAAESQLDERFLDGLRQRQLYSLAEKFCRDRLARRELTETKRADLTIELARCQLEEALQAAPEARDAIWRQALDTIDGFARQYPKNPRLVQARVQRGLIELARGELLAVEAEVAGKSDERLSAARDHLRRAIDDLRGAGEQAADMLRRQQMGRKAEPGELGTAALRSLTRNVQYQLARALRSQGESYPLESADRTNSLAQAVELLRPLADAEADASDLLSWPSRLDAATCYRLLGHIEAATRKLDLIADQSPPAPIALRARAERIRLALAEQHVDEAVALADEPRTLDGQQSPDLDFAALEAYLAAWRAAVDTNRTSAAEAWQAKAAAAVRDIDRNFGPYWRRRAEGRFAELVAASPATTDVAVLARAAEGFYRAGQIDEALAAYDRAAAQASASRQDAKAFELAYAAAAIEQQRKNFAAAAERFAQAALTSPQLPKAAEAHLLAAYDAGQAARSGAPEAIEQYVKRLEAHLTSWPADPTAARAHLWLGRVYEHDRQWQKAIDEYAAIRAAPDDAGEAAAGLARSYQTLLAGLRAAGKPTAAAAGKAVSALETANGLKGTAPADLSREQLQTVLAVAQILLQFTDDGFAAAEKLLTEPLARNAAAPDEWKASARGLLVYATAAQGRAEDAQRHLEQLANAGPQALQAVVERLDALSLLLPPARKESLAALELRAIEMIGDRAAGATDHERQALALARARALQAAGRRVEAAAEFKRLAEAHPRDGRIQEALAVTLTAANDPAALAAWQNVERHARSGSERWMRAKLQQALVYERRGEPARAVATVNVVRSLYPDMGGPEQKRRFLDVLKRCQ